MQPIVLSSEDWRRVLRLLPRSDIIWTRIIAQLQIYGPLTLSEQMESDRLFDAYGQR